MAGYHVRKIKKGVLGEISKVREELEEYEDAIEQGIHIMADCELADLYGALEAVADCRGYTMDDLAAMSDATKRAFKDGTTQIIFPNVLDRQERLCHHLKNESPHQLQLDLARHRILSRQGLQLRRGSVAGRARTPSIRRCRRARMRFG